MFEWEHAEIAAALGRSEAACRQLHHRARGHVEGRHQRFCTTEAQATRLAHAFVLAAGGGDREEVARLLAEDAVVVSDGGGVAKSALRPIHGGRRVAAFLCGVARKVRVPVSPSLAWVNHEIAVLLHEPSGLTGVLVLGVDGDTVRAVRWVRNPRKLAHLARALAG